MSAAIGKLTVRVLRARNLTAADSNGLSDPWCRLRLAPGDTPFAKLQSAEKIGKTKVIPKTLNPEWIQEFEIPVHDVHDILVVEMWDKDLLSNDEIGWTYLAVRDLVADMKSGESRWIPLDIGNGGNGEVQLSFAFSTDFSAILANSYDEAGNPRTEIGRDTKREEEARKSEKLRKMQKLSPRGPPSPRK